MAESLTARLEKFKADSKKIEQKIEQKNKQLEQKGKELEQAQHRLQRMEDQQNYRRSAKDRARTHRLIQYGAAFESSVRELSILFDDEIYLMIKRILRVDGVNEIIQDAVANHKGAMD